MMMIILCIIWLFVVEIVWIVKVNLSKESGLFVIPFMLEIDDVFDVWLNIIVLCYTSNEVCVTL